MSKYSIIWLPLVTSVLVGCATDPAAPSGTEAGRAQPMSFFVTSVNPGNGANFGGLAGADQHCQSLASAAGAGGRTWRAYLSTQGKSLTDPEVVHARDRIGKGPWYNANGVLIARNVEELHSDKNNIKTETAVSEKGNPINDRTKKPSHHDILTGSRPDGTAFAGGPFYDMTCGNWTKGGQEGSAMTGHHDRAGPIGHPWAMSWNSAHPTRGCHPEGLLSTGGAGLLYCFATN